MAGIYLRRWATGVVLIAGAALTLASVVARWPSWTTMVVPLASIVCVSLLSVPRRTRANPDELSASDAYSDAYLGRPQPTHPHHDAQAASQIGDRLPPDPLFFPERE